MKSFLIKFIILVGLLSVHHLYAQCDFTNGTVVVSASGYTSTAGYTQAYVLVENTSGLISAINTSGTFSGVTSGNYRIYAVNYNGSQPSVLAVNGTWTNVSSYDANSSNCFASLGMYLGRVVTVCNPTTVSCDFFNGTIAVSATGYTATAGYTQEYVLVENTTDVIKQITSTGIFNSLFNGEYRVYAINYTGSRPVAVAVNSLWAGVSSYDANSANCFSATTMYLGRAVTVCNTVCNGANISATTSGYQTAAGYSQYYVAVNSSGNIVGHTTNGNFPSLGNGAYSVYAVNTNSATITGIITANGAWSSVTALQASSCVNIVGPRYYSVSIGCPLPTALLDFRGKNINEYNEITWQFSSEKRADKYELQRSENSKNGYHTIAVYNDTKTGNSYNDYKPLAANYYRLKYETDGKVNYSNIIYIEIKEKDKEIRVYPNPAVSMFSIEYQSAGNEEILVQLINTIGEEIKTINYSITEGNNTLSFPFENISAGVYLVRVNTTYKSYVQKLIVKQ